MNPAVSNRLIHRFFTSVGYEAEKAHPYSYRTAEVWEKDELIFKQERIQVPDTWSDMALAMAAQKYFWGQEGTSERETSIFGMVDRVALTIALWGGFRARSKDAAIDTISSDPALDYVADEITTHLYAQDDVRVYARPKSTKQGQGEVYFDSYEEFRAFYDELREVLLSQRASFNSPVWFNLGVQGPTAPGQQCSACFINRVEDYFEGEGEFGILDLPIVEGKLFKRGSGSGIEISRMRSSKELVTGGGLASGGLSFSKGSDRSGRTIRSGGRVRRAAMLRGCAADYGDIMAFINVKRLEEIKAKILAEHGYGTGIDSESYDTVAFQGANFSVRITDELMEAYEEDHLWALRSRIVRGAPEGEALEPNHFGDPSYIIEQIRARDLIDEIAKNAWECGDPGVQFHDTINRWHTCKETDKIWASNPCSEFMFLDTSACNLASLNLVKFYDKGLFDTQAFDHTVRLMLTAMEILVSNSEYPTETIAKTSHRFRPLGLGYGNLGALLMQMGMPYNSYEGRDMAGAVTSLLTATAYHQSMCLAERMGDFPGYSENKQSLVDVLTAHANESLDLEQKVHGTTDTPIMLSAAPALLNQANELWTMVAASGHVRNAQVTVLAPTGTIGFLMDLDTTGCEPLLAHVTHKRLVGGGILKKESTSVRPALEALGYPEDNIKEAMSEILSGRRLEDLSWIKEEHLPIFDTSFYCAGGKRVLPWQAHVHMLATIQPFISGSISKTVNMPEDTTIEQIKDAYVMAWRLGLKCLAVYRDNCKMSQPISAEVPKASLPIVKGSAGIPTDDIVTAQPFFSGEAREVVRYKPPRRRPGFTTTFRVGGHKGYIHTGENHETGELSEAFLELANEGSSIRGFASAFSIMFSYAIQYGAPLKKIVDRLRMHRHPPSGFTDDPEIRNVPSVVAYFVRHLGLYYLPIEDQAELGLIVRDMNTDAPEGPQEAAQEDIEDLDHSHHRGNAGLVCGACGGFNVFHIGAANCLQCFDCGWSEGGCSG